MLHHKLFWRTKNMNNKLLLRVLFCVLLIGVLAYISGDKFWILYIQISEVGVAIIAALIAYEGYQIADHSRRKERFLFLNKFLNTNQYRIRKYIEEHTDDCKCTYLFHQDGWMRTTEELIPIKNVALLACSEKADSDNNRTKVEQEFRAMKILPNSGGNVTDNLLMYTELHMYDALSYCLDSFTISDKDIVQIGVSTESYFGFVNTCFPFGFEAAYNCFYGKALRGGLLQLRKDFPIFDYRNRYASIGIVALVVLLNVKNTYNEEKQHYILLHKRGTNVSESQGMINAVPGCTFQPTSGRVYDDLQMELNREGIIHTITREFLEEIKSYEEFSFQTSSERIRREPLLNIVAENCYYLGGGVNPINVYFEVLTVLFMDMTRKDVQQYFGGTSLKSVTENLDPNEEGIVYVEKLSRDNLLFYENNTSSTPALQAICHILSVNDTIPSLITNKYGIINPY